MDEGEDQINSLKDRVAGNNQSRKMKNKIFLNEDNLRDLGGNIKSNNIHIIEIAEGEERQSKELRAYLKK